MFFVWDAAGGCVWFVFLHFVLRYLQCFPPLVASDVTSDGSWPWEFTSVLTHANLRRMRRSNSLSGRFCEPPPVPTL